MQASPSSIDAARRNADARHPLSIGWRDEHCGPRRAPVRALKPVASASGIQP